MFEMIAQIIADQKGLTADQILPESSFDALGVDSLDAVDIIMAVEDAFEIKISLRTKLATVQQLLAIVEDTVNAAK